MGYRSLAETGWHLPFMNVFYLDISVAALFFRNVSYKFLVEGRVKRM